MVCSGALGKLCEKKLEAESRVRFLFIGTVACTIPSHRHYDELDNFFFAFNIFFIYGRKMYKILSKIKINNKF
jgi:hypothetical protein